MYEHADDEAPFGVLTGDTLFIGDVGRPDLLSSIGFTREDLADKLYDSLHNKLMTLPDSTRVYPAHGAGSACGKNLSTELSSTIGDQQATNYALRAPDKQTFVALVTEGQPPAPSYFVYDAILNRTDHELLDETKMPTPTTTTRRRGDHAGAVLVDGRNPEEFAQGHLRGAINMGLEGRYAEFAGSVLLPTSTSCCSPNPVRSWRARTGSPASASTGSSAISTSPTGRCSSTTTRSRSLAAHGKGLRAAAAELPRPAARRRAQPG